MLKKVLILLIVLAVAFFIINQRKSKSAEIKTVKPTIKDITQTVSASGKVKSDEEVNLSFQVLGQLAWVGVKEGDTVKKWQGIASLDQRVLKKTLEKDLNLYFTQRTKFDDDQKTYEVVLTDFIKRIRQRSQNSLDNSVIDIELQDISIKLSNLVTPIAGVVTRADAKVAGVNITPTTAWTISNPDKMIFTAEVDESDITLVSPGQTAIITLDAMPENPITATIESISYISHFTTSGATAYDVKFSLPANLNLRFGLNGEAVIEVVKKSSVLTVPNEAIFEKDNKKYVLVLNNKRTEEKEVQTGATSDNDTEIKSGLNDSDELLIER